MDKKSLESISQLSIGLSLICVILAGIGALGTDIYLASTQWLLVGIFLAVLGIYAKID